MVIKYMRADENERPVKVEIWRDDKTGMLIRIKRVTYCDLAGKDISVRKDFYQAENIEKFRAILAEELTFLISYEEHINDLLLPAKQLVDESAKNESSLLERMQKTVELLKNGGQ